MTKYKLASILSYILHPAILMLLTVIVYSSMIRSTFHEVIIDVAILLIGLVPGLIYIAVKTKKGDFNHYHLIIKEHRRVTLIILLGGLGLSFILYHLRNTPQTMIDGFKIALIGGVIIALITWFWKISFHAAVGAGCATLFITQSLFIAGIFFILSVISGIVRIPVKHHTSAQVIAGWLYGVGITTILLWFYGYM